MPGRASVPKRRVGVGLSRLICSWGYDLERAMYGQWGAVWLTLVRIDEAGQDDGPHIVGSFHRP